MSKSNKIAKSAGKKKPSRRTYAQTKVALKAKDYRPIVNANTMSQYAIQCGFSQVGRGVTKLLNEIILDDILSVVIKNSMLQADANKEKSLKKAHAIHAIEQTKLIPPGNY
jgi:hypothetical protein